MESKCWIFDSFTILDAWYERGVYLQYTCLIFADLFLCSYENEFLDKLIKEDERKLARKFSYRYTETLSLSKIKDWRNASLMFTPKNSPFLRLRNLLQLLLISTYFLLEMRTTTLSPNYMTNVMLLVYTLRTFPLCQAIFDQHQPTVYEYLSSFAMSVVVQVIVTFYNATGPWWQDFCYRVTKLIVYPTQLRNSVADTLI